jgi:hypothetical protein
MTEAEVELLLSRAERRLRIGGALRVALAALGLALLLAVAAIVWLRLSAVAGPLAAGLLAFPVAAMLGAFVVAFHRQKLRPEQAALVLDRRAHSHEQLVTWLYLRGLSAEALGATGQGFKEAQRKDMLAQAGQLRIAALIPINLPVWGRALWLAVILVLCALLMPPREALPPVAAARANNGGAAAAGEGGLAAVSPRPENQLPRVEVLSPTEMRRLQLIAIDPRMSLAQKLEALKELRAKIGNLSERDLSPDVRELLETLRAETGEKNGTDKATGRGDGETGGPGDATLPVPSVLLPAVRYQDFARDEKAWSQIEEQLSDVRVELARYYGRK